MSQQVNEELEEAIRMKRRYLGELTNQLKIVSELKQRMSTMEVVHSSSKWKTFVVFVVRISLFEKFTTYNI